MLVLFVCETIQCTCKSCLASEVEVSWGLIRNEAEKALQTFDMA